MIFPKFTLRNMFLGTVGCALIFALMLGAFSGHVWAVSILLALGSMLLCFLMFGLLFLTVSLFATLFSRSRGKRRSVGESPFAETRRPPQLLRPDEPN